MSFSLPSHSELRGSLERLLRGCIVFLSLLFILLFLYTALRRMRYPFELEWIESGMLMSVRRVAQGLPLYSRPTLHFVPFLYAPLYIYLAAALTKLTGVGYATLRLLSTVSTLGCFAVIYGLVHEETRDRLSALAGAGLFAACYQVSGEWFDLGRVDSLFVFFFLLGIYCGRRGNPVLAALVWLLAFQTKQTILPVAVLMLCADWERPRRALAGLATFVIGAAASIVALNHFTQGWYAFYVFGAPRGLPIVWRLAALYLTSDLLAPLGISFLIALGALLFAPPRYKGARLRFYAVVSFAVYASIWYVKAHRGATTNTAIPAYAWTAALFGIALHRLLRALTPSETHSQMRSSARILVLSAAVVQLAMLTYNPGQYLPTAKTLAMRRAFVEQLRALPGTVLMLNHTEDEVLAGKPPSAEMEALGAIIDGPSNPASDQIVAELKSSIEARRYGAIVLDGPASTLQPGEGWVPADMDSLYPASISAIGADQPKFLTSQPQWILLPCSDLKTPTGGVPSYINPQTYILPGGCSMSK